MKLNIILSFLMILLFGLFTFTKYENYQIQRENLSLKSYLSKAIMAVERENIFWRIDMRNLDRDRYSNLKNIDSMFSHSISLDSNNLHSMLLEISQQKLKLNDSLNEFAPNRCNYGTFIYSCMYFLEHKPIYKYGDTIDMVFRLDNYNSCKKNYYEIIGFTQKEYGKLDGSVINYSIPTTALINENQFPKKIKVKYVVKIRNIYTNNITDIPMEKEITIN